MKKLFNDNAHYWPLKEESHKARCWIYHPETELPKSIGTSRYFPGGDAKHLAEYWYENNKAVSDFLAKIPQQRFLIIKEEELISKPRDIIKQCYQFLGVEDYLPESLISRIDSNRNSLWHEKLTDRELHSLLQFVVEQGKNLNTIFPGESPYRHYKNEILRVI
jgi:hypothetical protein